ncbi:MAG: helix-turn-helix transcriptional regulator [Clostridia bacterium]|nr:helix-turn-helix transcriptional regulator [Clostridia bacterium]
MSLTILPVSEKRQVLLCGTNVYPVPETHLDRIMDVHDLLYIFSGEQPVAQEEESFTLRTGDLVLLRAGSHHYGTAPCSVNMRSIFIHFNQLPGDRAAESLSGEEIQRLNRMNNFVIPTVVHCGQNNEITRIINAIIDLYWSHRPNKERRLQFLLNLLLDDLCLIGQEEEEQQEEWTVALVNLFRKHPECNYSLEELAEAVNMSVRTMSARFREIMGKSVHQYQMDLKLEMAYRDLRTGTLNVREVADRYGFTDAFYFSRLFKKKFGIAPRQIKEREPSANINRNRVT